MPGKRRDFSGQFAISEVDFWLNDPRVRGGGSAFKTYIHYAWMIAVKERRETLPIWWQTESIGKAAGLEPRTSRKCAQRARENSLHGQTADGRVIVYGVKAKHPNLTWKDGDISDDLQTHIVAQTESESETQTESEAERPTRKKRAPSAVEKNFMDGFKSRHGHEPEIDKGHAVRLAQLVGKHGTEIVIAKINAWWTSGAGAWADERGTNRDIAAFLTSFDRIAIGGPNGNGVEIDTSRFDAATVES
jgi:hypothetical protein